MRVRDPNFGYPLVLLGYVRPYGHRVSQSLLPKSVVLYVSRSPVSFTPPLPSRFMGDTGGPVDVFTPDFINTHKGRTKSYLLNTYIIIETQRKGDDKGMVEYILHNYHLEHRVLHSISYSLPLTLS